MARLIRLVKPLTGFMLLAILMGLVGHLCAAFITIFGGYAVLEALHFDTPFTLTALFACVVAFAVVRGFLRYAEQACNHFIAFKLLALLRDRVFRALRRLCPAKLEGRDKGDLISVITSDIELLEVFYAHTISPAAIAFLFTIVMCLFIGYFHWLLGLIALAAYLIVGIVIPLGISELSVGDGMKFRRGSGELSGFVLDSLRGLSETLQYGQGRKRLVQMNEKTDALAKDEERMKRTAGRNSAVTNTVVLVFDLVMLFVSALLYQSGAVGFDGVLIPTIALFSSFGPAIALAALGSTLQNTFAAGNRVLDILEEMPVVEEVTGRPEIAFTGAAAEHVTFAYGEETILSNVSVEIPKHSVVGIVGRSGSGKSTLADALSAALNAPIIRMDDFFLPHALKTPQRLAIPGGNVDLERLMQEVIIPFAAGQPVVYRRYLCREDAFSAPIPLPDAPITILEGSYSMLPDIRRHADLTLFLRINPEVQQERLLQRVGAARLKDFNARWIPLENAYFDAYHLPDESCVLVPQDVKAPVRP